MALAKHSRPGECNRPRADGGGVPPTTLYFEGALPPASSFEPHDVRGAAVGALRGRPGFALRGGQQERTADVAWDAARSAFCLAPGGTTGGFGGRELEAVGAGCVPLYINDNTSRHGGGGLVADGAGGAGITGLFPALPSRFFEDLWPSMDAFSLRMDEAAILGAQL